MPLFKYMSAEVAPLFAKTLKVRFTQPFELNDPFELRPMLDFIATAEEARPVLEDRVNNTYGTVDDVFALLEKQQTRDPDFASVLRAPPPRAPRNRRG